MKTDTKFCFVLFCVVFEETLCSESVTADKTARVCLEFTFFHLFTSFVLEFYLKIVLSHAHKWVISDVILLKLSLTGVCSRVRESLASQLF